jgi:hypothetical protein
MPKEGIIVYLAEYCGWSSNASMWTCVENWFRQKINIWEDHWVSTSPTKKVVTPRAQIVMQTVNELIDPLTNLWDEQTY